MASNETATGPADDGVDPAARRRVGGAAGRYLLAVYRESDGGARRVEMRDVRRTLGVSPASVTEMVERLADRSLVDHEKYRGVTPTPVGRDVGASLAWAVCAVETFFASVVDARLDAEAAYEISSVLSDATLRALRRRSAAPCIDDCPRASEPEDRPARA